MLRLRLRSLFRRVQVEQELNDEMQYHLDRQIEEFKAKGLTAKEARYAALRQFNGIEHYKEECRDTRRVRVVDHVVQDLRHGFRTLRKNPGFAVVAALTLALGIGVNTTVFTMIDAVLLRPLPYHEPEQLVRVYRTSQQSQSWPHAAPNFLDYRAQNDVFTQLAAFTWTSFNVSDPGQPAERVPGLAVTADFFPLLGVQPVVGRIFTQEEDRADVPKVVVISHRFWMSRFGGDGNVIGRSVRFNGAEATVIGVMPDSFENPLFFNRTDVWAPIAFTDRERQDRGNNYLNVVGRLKRDLSPAQAGSKFAALADRIRNEHGEKDRREGVRLESFKRSIIPEGIAELSTFTFGMTLFVLLIACVNLANLQLGRTTMRLREFALRAALGGGRRRLIQQSLIESLTLSVIGGSLAIPASMVSAKLLAQQSFGEVPRLALVFDYKFFFVAFACALLAGITFGLVPALLASRSDLNTLVKDNSRSASTPRSQRRLRHALIVAEVALALVLLAGTGTFIRGLSKAIQTDPGWHADGLLVGRIGLDGPNYAHPRRQLEFINRLREHLATLPGVEKAAVSLSVPTWIHQWSGDIIIEGSPDFSVLLNTEIVSPQYFDTLEIPLKQGRGFSDNDRYGQPSVLIINETMARRFWPNENPIGKRLAYAGDAERRWVEIIGVVGDIKFPTAMIKQETEFTMYRPIAQNPLRGARVILRTASGTEETLIPSVRKVAAELDPDQPIFDLRTARDLARENLTGFDFAAKLLGVFSALGLGLAAVGIFGVVSYSVTQRTSEIGIRVALGAARNQVRWMVLRQGMTVSFLGAIIGTIPAFGASRILSFAIPGLPFGDTMTFVAMTALLLGVALLACYLPACRASKVDPMIALRHE